jgi:hypothetical protein
MGEHGGNFRGVGRAVGLGSGCFSERIFLARWIFGWVPKSNLY